MERFRILMACVGRYLTLILVVLLVVAVWAILVAPDYDLDPTVLAGKQAIAWGVWAAMLLTGFMSCALLFERRQRRDEVPLTVFPSLVALTCARLC
jgi:FtsH-binding integral membrane protein